MNAETEFSSWSRSLEDVARDRWGRSFRPQLEGLAFAPKLVREPRAYDKTPVVMLVASSASALLHRPLFDAVELLEKATGAFKVVVFTDCPASSGVRDFDWAVEHCMAEPDWDTVSTTNWLEMAAKRLTWASSAYKPAFVIAAIDEATAGAEIRRLGRAFSIDEAVLEGAVAHLRSGLEGLQPEEHPTLRGWLDNLVPSTESNHRIRLPEYEGVELDIVRGNGRLTLLVEAMDSSLERLKAAAEDNDWNVVAVQGLAATNLKAAKNLLYAIGSGFSGTLLLRVLGRTVSVESECSFTAGVIFSEGRGGMYSLCFNHERRTRDVDLTELMQTLQTFVVADEIASVL